MNWYEELPSNCPPEESFLSEGKEYYRLCKAIPASTTDFHSQLRENPTRSFAGISDCILKSVSIWDNLEKCLIQKKYPTQKNKVIGKIVLNKEDGRIKNTFKQHHYSWWRSTQFNPTLTIAVD